MATVTSNYMPMSLPGAGPRAGGGMGKGGGKPGGAPGMGGKGGGMRPPAPMGTLPDRFRGGPMGTEVNFGGPPMRPPQSPVLPPPQKPGLAQMLNMLQPSSGGMGPQNPVLPPPPNRENIPPLNLSNAIGSGMSPTMTPQILPPTPVVSPQVQPGLFNFMSRLGG